MTKKIFRSFKDSQKWAREKGIVSQSDWYSKASIRPADVPADPSKVYQGEFKSWSDFLGSPRASGNRSKVEAILEKELSFFCLFVKKDKIKK